MRSLKIVNGHILVILIQNLISTLEIIIKKYIFIVKSIQI